MPELSNIGLLTVFAAGIISFLSPCVLPLVPGYVSYVAGRSAAGIGPSGTVAVRLPAVILGLCFVLGFSTVFIVLGASATALGQALISYRYELNLVGGAILILFGLFVTGLIRLPWMMREARFHSDLPGGGATSAYVLGLAFAFGWTPCIGPILGAILTVGASSATVADGVLLLAIYSLGLGVPFLLAALFTDALTARLRTFGQIGRVLRVLAGGVMILMGVAMITGYLSVFSFWLLENFPLLARLG
jgi:cytochrome c-type biogenesis protein